ncbi:MAG TPA: GNAT family N-acetyltransferase [Microscillaceae bacterium]|nr:GNAT family N-acetyltransferase [Microscillaceae bacterium]
MLEYHPVEEQDLEYLLWLRKQTMDKHLVRAGIPTTTEEHLLRIRYQMDHAQIIWWHNKRIGLLKLVKDSHTWEIIQFQIAPDFQGQGIGQQVLTSVLQEAKAKHISVKLSVLKQNPAQRLYQKMGFELTQEDEQSYYYVFNSGR